jgi:hypothetical protein
VSRITSALIAVFLLATLAVGQKVSNPAPTAPNSSSLTVFLVNDNVDRSVFDRVTASIESSGAWRIVNKREDADLLLILSEKVERASYAFDPMPLFESNVYYCRWPVVMDVDTLTLRAVKRASDRELVAVSCARHHVPSAPRWLVSRLRKKMEKLERSGG